MPIQTTIKFIDDENKPHYKKTVLAWLKSDFNEQGEPENHFWNNKSIIETAFDNCKAMVALNDQAVFIGYMIWNISDDGGRGEIDIIEVKKDYRGQGIFKKMLSTFCDKYTELSVLSANVLPQSEVVFTKAGWQTVYSAHNHQKKYFKLMKPLSKPHDSLPDGLVIAVCSENCYKIQAKPEAYKESMRYFPVDLDQDGKLSNPIVTDFKYEGYIGVYFNQALVVQGKAKHLFETTHDHSDLNLLIINKIKFPPQNLKLFSQKGFFPEVCPKIQAQKESFSSQIESSIVADTETNSNSEYPIKRQRLEISNHPIFQPAEKEYQGLEDQANETLPEIPLKSRLKP